MNASGSVHADAALFRRAVNNLVANAVRHAVKGSTVRLTARQEQEVVEVSVVNEGVTIDPAHIPRLFDRFYRADKSRSDSSSATGLGLSIVQSIMQLHDGRTEVDSAAGVTTFRLQFPR